LRQNIGWIVDDRVDTRLRCLTQEVHALSDIAAVAPRPSCRCRVLAPKSCR
jgi:hypothetical protein